MFKASIGAVLALFVLAGCAVPMIHQDGGPRMQMRMGQSSGMMARHHATIPAAYRGMTNPVAADEESLARGAELFSANCASCHGDGGMGDGPAGKTLDPAASPIAHTSQMLGDDYLFWRISEGGVEFQSAMPPWKGALDEEARWDLINYVRALGSGDVMPMQNMGGASFDPASELAQRETMLTTAVEQGVIDQAAAEAFSAVHAALDEFMKNAEHGAGQGNMEQRQNAILAALVESGQITQEQSDIFQEVHGQLLAAGLMQ